MHLEFILYIFSSAKISQEFETSNSLEQKNQIFIQIERNMAHFVRKNQISIRNEQFPLNCVIQKTEIQ